MHIRTTLLPETMVSSLFIDFTPGDRIFPNKNGEAYLLIAYLRSNRSGLFSPELGRRQSRRHFKSETHHRDNVSQGHPRQRIEKQTRPSPMAYSLAFRARRSSNLHQRMKPPPSTDLSVTQPGATAYLSHLQEASHSNANNNVQSSIMYIESCVNEG